MLYIKYLTNSLEVIKSIKSISLALIACVLPNCLMAGKFKQYVAISSSSFNFNMFAYCSAFKDWRESLLRLRTSRSTPVCTSFQAQYSCCTNHWCAVEA